MSKQARSCGDGRQGIAEIMAKHRDKLFAESARAVRMNEICLSRRKKGIIFEMHADQIGEQAKHSNNGWIFHQGRLRINRAQRPPERAPQKNWHRDVAL